MCRRCLISAVLILFAALPVIADDCALSSGGSPRMLSGHKTVVMESEVVRIHIGKTTTKVDCDFLFRNDGPACTVRMGFPDEGAGDTRFNYVKKQGAFLSFRSYVNGKETPTRMIQAEIGRDPLHKERTLMGLWHAKSVHFPAHSVVRVRDVYTTPVSVLQQPYKSKPANTGVAVLHCADYTLRTGASWKGKIGSAEIIVTFDRARPTVPLDALPIRRSDNPLNDRIERDTLYNTAWNKRPNLVYWRGFAEPTVQGKQLRFVRKNWKPTDRSDLGLFFDMETLPLHPATVQATVKHNDKS